MELTAVIRALELVPSGSSIILHTDSAAVVSGITERLPWWRSRGWRTIKGRKVQNRELWQQLADLSAARQVTWNWIKGHAGEPGNEHADALARAQARLVEAGIRPSQAPKQLVCIEGRHARFADMLGTGIG